MALIGIGVILGLGYLYFAVSGGSRALASIGLISFAGMAQALPVLMGALFWRGASRSGAIAGLLTGIPLSPGGIVLVILFIAFVAGFFLDWLEISLILLPLVGPVVVQLGFDLTWFVVLFALTLQTSFLTPPVGFSLFYLKGVAPPEIKTTDII